MQTGKRRRRPRILPMMTSGVWASVDRDSFTSDLAAESELLQKVTDYSAIEITPKESNLSALKTTTPVEGSVHGAGDSTLQRSSKKHSMQSKSRTTGLSRPSMMTGRSRGALPPIKLGDSHSRISVISDCRLRNLRLDTQYEVSSEKVDTPPGETVKRKT